MHFSYSLLILGVVGLLGSTLGTSVLAWCVTRFSKTNSNSKNLPKSELPTLDILIPAHNEERLISQTLRSIADAVSKVKPETLQVSIVVGLDHTTDQTFDRIQHFIYRENTDVKTEENLGAPGKWNMLLQMVEKSQADWIAFVDSGSIWNESLLKNLIPYFHEKEILGVAPSYCAANAGVLERLNWALERTLKSIESASGGPVSVHGATVFYARTALLHALKKLEGQSWLNDDVVIPLTLRTLFPERKLVYLARHPKGEAWVSDIGIQRDDVTAEFRRRRRMIFGNLQWMSVLLIPAFRSNLSVGLIASRRVFRTFWAYAALFLIAGLLIQPNTVLSLGSLFLLVFLFRMRSAFIAGLRIPFQFFVHQQSLSSPSEKSWN